MKQDLTETDFEIAHPGNSRREFLTQIAAAGLGVAALSLTLPAEAALTPDQPAADSGHHYPLTKIYPKTGKEFGEGILGLVSVSKIISGIGVDRATNSSVKEYANFELRETIAILTILNGGQLASSLNKTLKSILASVKSAQGAAFDKGYIGAQLAGHEWLRDTAEIYLKNSEGATSEGEKHARDLATLSLAFIKEHIVLAKDIIADLA
jgi:putative membrane protein